MLVRWSRRILATCLGLYLLGQILFLINIQFPRTPNFDEFHYVPAAKAFLELKKNQNWEHPPLAKELMAVGISIWGDRPIGWRFMSTVFGALTLVGMYVWGLAVFETEQAALLVALISLFNHLLYVQARIGMLDTFMAAFLVWGIAMFCAAWNTENTHRQVLNFFAYTGILFGLATACKWVGIVAWGACLACVVLVWLFQHWGVRFDKPETHFKEWYSQALWKDVPAWKILLRLVLLPVFVYFVTFLPFLFVHKEPAYTLMDLLRMQPAMWQGQLRVTNPHPYMSQWTGWPLMLRPIWYAFDTEPTTHRFVRGVLLLGNPFVMWGGLLALGVCVWGFLIHKSRQAFLIVMCYAALYLSWGIIPRKVSFYYYYYPAGLTLSLALAFVFVHWQSLNRWVGKSGRYAQWVFVVACAGMFIYFFPILAALKIPAEEFRKWMWFSRWI